ncbi:MAG TPA: helix-turn-helix domain-containing protein, partial [Polyangiaceae bacterium]
MNRFPPLFGEQHSSAAARAEVLLSSAEQLLELHVTVHDRAAVLRDADGAPLLHADRLRHANPFCELGRTPDSEWDKNCIAHCQRAVNAHALRVIQPFSHQCWKGAQEAVAPIFRGEQHLLTVFGGVFRNPEASELVWSGLGAQAAEAWLKLPTLDMERLRRISNVLLAVGHHLLGLLDETQQFSATGVGRIGEIRRFIHYNAHEPVKLADLARVLFLSPSRARHAVKELFGVAFQDLVLQERIARARILLVTTRQPLGTIAARVGFASEHYFNRAFKKLEGMPPGRYREKNAVPVS